MDNLRKDLKNYVLQFLTPLEVAQVAKTSSFQLKLFKSTVDLDLIHFYTLLLDI